MTTCGPRPAVPDPLTPLLITVSAASDDPALTVSPVGELDLATAPALYDAVTAALSSEPSGPIRLDLAGVTFCDAAGLRVLRAAERDGVILTAPPPFLARLLRLTARPEPAPEA